jgi:DNA-binding response OmpR family regulator
MTPRKRILVVEDDEALARVLADNLRFSGFEVECEQDADGALARARAAAPDVVLLDVMLPGRNGIELCRVIRRGGTTPVIMLTARDQKSDKLSGLEAGADDYITKPFDFDELVARIRAVLRRARTMVVQVRLGHVIVDFRELRATDGHRDVHLTHREFDILSYLAERQGRVVHRNELLREVWGYPEEPTTRAVDYAIKRLRGKLEPDPHRPRFLHAVRGDGYCLTVD